MKRAFIKNSQIIIMKGQILSRIQSYQNIPSLNAITSIKNTKNPASTIINQAKFQKYIVNNVKQTSNSSIKLLSPPPKVIGQRFYLSGSTLSSHKKLNNCQSHHRQLKRSLNFELKTIEKSSELKNNRIPKRLSEKYLPNQNQSKDLQKQTQNELNYYENSNFQTSIHHSQNLNTLALKQANKSRKKHLIKFFNKYQGNKSAKVIAAASQQQILYNEKDTEQCEGQREPELAQCKTINLMMKTVNVFKDYKQSPYFNMSNKKFTIKSPQKIGPTKSLNRIPTVIGTQKDDVSIQLSGDDIGKQDQAHVIQNLQFGCSEIKQEHIDNDSSFLESCQKNIIGELEQICKKDQLKKRKWKKLPNDFLKV